MNTGCMCLLELVLSPLSKHPEVELPDHMVVLYFIFISWDTKYLARGYTGYTPLQGFAI